MEAQLEAHKADPRIAPVASLLARCRRQDAILLDIAFHGGGAPSPPLASTLAYIEALKAACAKSPVNLLAYAYTMYMAILAGGKILAAMLKVTMGLSGDSGTALFALGSAESNQAPSLRDQLRDAMDRIGDRLSSAEVQELVSHKCEVFTRNDTVIAETLRHEKGAVLAWLRVLASAGTFLLSSRRAVVAGALVTTAALALVFRHCSVFPHSNS